MVGIQANIRTGKLFSADSRLGDILLANNFLIPMLPRFGIRFGFGNKTIGEVCRENGVPADFFLLICNVYTFEGYMPSRSQVRATDMTHLVAYLEASHRYYLKRMNHIEGHLSAIASKTDAKYGKMLLKFWDGCKKDIESHFSYEESIVFPYLTGLMEGVKDKDFSISEFAGKHGSPDESLSDLTQIIFKYLPSGDDSEDSVEIAFDIFQFSSDISKHTLIENKIMVPYAEMLEKEVK